MKTNRSGYRPLLAVLLLSFMCVCAFCVPATAAPPPGTTYITGNLSLGTFAADLVSINSGISGFKRPDSAVVVADLTVHNILGPLTLETCYRQPLYGSNYWNSHVEQLAVDLTTPLGFGTAFVHYERNPATGFQWGWCGVRVPFRL